MSIKPQLIVVDSVSAIKEIGVYLADKDLIAYDCETTGLTQKDEIIGVSLCAEENIAYYIILAKWNKDLNRLDYVYGARDATAQLLQDLTKKNLIMHNGVFDCMMAESYFKINLIDSLHTDTMVLAHLLDENRRIGLKELSNTMFGEDSAAEQKEMKQSVLDNGGKLTVACYEMFKADPYLMGKYGAKDAWLTYKLFLALVPDLYEQGLDQFFYEDELMPLLRGPTYELNTIGLQVDLAKLQTLKKTLEAECLEAKEFIYREIDNSIKEKYPGTNPKNKFNIGAPVQLSWLLFGKMGLEFGTLTKSGKEICKALGLRLPYSPVAKRQFIHSCEQSIGKVYQPEVKTMQGIKRAKKFREPWAYIMSDKKTLAKFASKYKWIATLLEYQRKMKLLNTYVEGIESRLQYGIIRPSFLQHGTTSGRYASRNPNFQNLPRDDKRIKSCIIARPGMAFVGADYSQLEPRVFAYFSKDQRLLEAFNGTDDFYSVIGMEVYGKDDCTPQKEGSPDAFGVKYKKLRDLSKVIALASTYGATAHQLAPTTGKNIEDTQKDMDSYFERFPGVKQMMLHAHELAKESGQVHNLFGRPRRMPEAMKFNKIYGNIPHKDLPYEARNVLNLAVNHRIQSTSASIVNRAAIQFHKDCKQAGIKARLVLQVHDSLIVECKKEDADNILILLQNSMENTVQLEGIRLEAIPRVGYNLAEV